MTLTDLCMALMRADTEADVVALLSASGYWDDPSCWRDLGDDDTNFSTIGSQQSEAVAALIEKLVNGIDARLMNACWLAGIDPASSNAPQSIRDAVAAFFEGIQSPGERDGRIADWPDEKATAQAKLLTLAATGHMAGHGMPSLTIADQGEGQEPDRFPDTFLSLHRSNKDRIHFVQGKFNMGGTGALQFCSGQHKLQLIVSRRNPTLVANRSPARAGEWGFTVIRREPPRPGRRSSVFTYLAPVGANETAPGGVLSFSATSWPIFPDVDGKVRDAYHRHSEYGSLIKLYEYEWGSTTSNIVRSGGGLLQRLDVGLPELALPVRIYECRPEFRGHSGSFATNLMGLSSRLQKDRNDNLEPDLPSGKVINLDGFPVKLRIFAFKPKKDRDYRTARQGVVFSVNGQAHAAFSTDFFRRKSVGMSYLADSLLVLADCSAIAGQMREDLFMNSRDRLRDIPLARRLEKELEVLLRDDPTLKELRNRRRSEELSEKLADSKPLVNLLQDILKNSPTLAKLLLQGVNLSSPFPPSSGGGKGTSGEFHGKTYPTYFRFKGLRDGDVLHRDAHLGSRVRITMETDAEDEYFLRDLDPGACRLIHVAANDEVEVTDWVMGGLRSGLVTFSLLDLPETLVIGDTVVYRIEVTDPSRIDAFVSTVELRVCAEAQPSDRHPYNRASHKNAGSGTGGGSAQLQLPNIVEVRQDEWDTRGFNELTALRIKSAGEAEGGTEVFDFFVNVDNKYLRLFQKDSREDPKLIKAKFVYGLVLVGLALLQDRRAADSTLGSDSPDPTLSIDKLVEHVGRAVAPVLLPLLESIGALEVADTD